MTAHSDPPLPDLGSEVKTACGGLAKFALDSPRALHNDQWVFFCLPTCKQEFEQAPATSCFAAQITSDQR